MRAIAAPLVGVVIRPWSALPQVADQQLTGQATVVWVAAWVLPLSILYWMGLGVVGALFATVIIGAIMGVLALVTLMAMSSVLETCLDQDHQQGQVRAVVGFSALPHLLVGIASAGFGTEISGLAVVAGIPGGLGLGFTAVFGMFQALDGLRSGGVIVFLVPLLVNLWSGALTVGAMKYMGASLFGGFRAYTGLLLLATVLWTFFFGFFAFLALFLFLAGMPGF